MIKLRILRWGDYPELSGGPKVITSILIKERLKGPRLRRCGSGSKVKMMPLLEGSQGMQMASSLESPERMQPYQHFAFSPETQFWTSDLQQ